MTLTVHFMQLGQTPCQMTGVPKDWAAGHRWSGDWEDVTCQECLRGRELIETFILGDDKKSITCKRCNRTSYNENDVRYHFCAYCGIFHDDLWPLARRWWIDNPETELAVIRCTCGWHIGFRWSHLMDTETNGVLRCQKCQTNLFDQVSKLRTHYHEAHKAH